jgi:hypothetical protein
MKKNLKEIDYPFNLNQCSSCFSKNGNFLFYPFNYYNIFYCILNKIVYSKVIYFPYLYGKNEDEIVKELLILEYFKKKSVLNFIIYNKKLQSKNNTQKIILFNNSVKDIIPIISFIYFVSYDKKLFSFIKKKYQFSFLIINFIIIRLKYSNKISNIKIFTEIFFNLFSNKNKSKFKEINLFLKKFNINLKEIPNYKELYKILKKIGFVKYYYNTIVPYILKHYKNITKFYFNSNTLKNKVKNILNNNIINNFKDIDIFQFIKNNVNNKYNKKYIKNKFIELSKKYNI